MTARETELLQALKRYGRHLPGCRGKPDIWFPKHGRLRGKVLEVTKPAATCNCGLAEELGEKPRTEAVEAIVQVVQAPAPAPIDHGPLAKVPDIKF